MKQSVAKKEYQTLTLFASKQSREAAEHSPNRSYRPSLGLTQDTFDNPSLQEGLMAAGYALTHTMPDELVPLTPVVSHNSCRCTR